MSNKEIETGIAIIGAGVTGLILLKKLSELGYDATLVDKQSTVGNDASSKNEGMIHMGTRHAVSTYDLQKAQRIVSKLQYGGNQILNYAPESISDPELNTFALLTLEDDVQAIVNRWDETGVNYQPISLGSFEKIVPEVNLSRVEHVFKTQDTPINVRVLYQKLLNDSLKAGGNIFLNQKFIAEDSQHGVIFDPEGNKSTIKADLFIITTGHAIKEIFEQITGQKLPIRLWQSHLVITPRLAKHGILHVRNGESIVTHHGNATIGGMWEDAEVVDSPSVSINSHRAGLVFNALERTFPNAKHHSSEYLAVSCIKPDIAEFAKQSRSVEIEVIEPDSSNYILALPGKMTEAPYVSDEILRMVFNRNSDERIAIRPIDSYQVNIGTRGINEN